MAERSEHTVSVRVSKELRRRMKALKVNWSSVLRGRIEGTLVEEERKRAVVELMQHVQRRPLVERGFAVKSIREDRDSR